MKFELAPLPYPIDALEPYIRARTLEFHYHKHHRGYLDKLAAAINGTPLESAPLEEIMLESSGAVFQNAAQVWNHDFYWKSMTPGGGGEPAGAIGACLVRCFGSWHDFRQRFIDCAAGLFGSGYVWLALDPVSDAVQIVPGKDADNPMLDGRIPLLCMDVWEHAYYLDYQNARTCYADNFLEHLANWSFADENLLHGRGLTRRPLDREHADGHRSL